MKTAIKVLLTSSLVAPAAAPFAPAAGTFYVKTTSISATFTFNTVTKTGGTLTWKVYNLAGTELLSSTANKPTFNLSTHPGTKWVVATSPDGWSGLTVFTATGKSLTLINCAVATALTTLGLNTNQLTALDVTTNTALASLSTSGNAGLVFTGLPALVLMDSFTSNNNGWSSANVNTILAALVQNEAAGNPARDAGVDLTTNAAPTGQGLTDAATLTVAGWSVIVDL